ncbi:MAG: geranylgeranylglyceryl/heptaprenylglyceryl phosphate synthase [Candidatus Thermoplasmatota archaeon]|nr:geranylgeranylglyceryl/heptaprenylglyceryl phosphate synthase [Candidatus Thermoplasmatota archaeon]
MSVIDAWLSENRRLHFSLIDPDSQPPQEAGKKARMCADYGTDAIMVGGTTVESRQQVYETVAAIKNATDLPVILFPNSGAFLVDNADYLFFMSLLNSTNPMHKFTEQLEGAPIVKKLGITPIPTGYMVISTSSRPTTVEKKTQLDKITYDDVEKAVKYALYTQFTGMHVLYMDAGSNPQQPISSQMIARVRDSISIPLIVGGGIRSADTAREKVEAGADIIVTGTAVEENIRSVKTIIQAVKEQ